MDRIQVLLNGSPVASFIFLVTVGLSIVVFLNRNLFDKLELRPNDFVQGKRRYTIITSGLIHANWQHLILNMLTFYFFAFALEAKFVYLQTVWTAVDDPGAQTMGEWIGRGKFFVLYFGCMIIADLSTIIKYRKEPSYKSVGASGALSGAVLAFIILQPNIMLFGAIPGWLFALVYTIGSYIAARTQPMSGIAHEAHLWGTLGALVLTPIMYPEQAWKFVQSVVDWTTKILG